MGLALNVAGDPVPARGQLRHRIHQLWRIEVSLHHHHSVCLECIEIHCQRNCEHQSLRSGSAHQRREQHHAKQQAQLISVGS